MSLDRGDLAPRTHVPELDHAIDAADRERAAVGREGQRRDRARVSPEDLGLALPIAEAPNLDLVALDEALTALSALDPRRGRSVELRFFAGLSVTETAEVLEVSPETVMRDWKVARAWLFRQLNPTALDR